MPTSTFFNLPNEKRQRIIEAAVDEFARRTFDEANISSIVKQAGIPRGSFYQYFEDKKDIYKYVLELIARDKMERIKPILARRSELGFFGTLRELFQEGAIFFLERPRYARIGELFMISPNAQIQREIYGESAGEILQFYRSLLQEGIAKGEIDPQVNVELVAELLSSIGTTVIERLVREQGLKELEQIMNACDEMIRFIKDGIACQ